MLPTLYTVAKRHLVESEGVAMGDSQRDGLVEGMTYLGEAQRSGLKYMGEAQWNGLKYIGDGLWVTGVSLGLTVGIGLLCVAVVYSSVSHSSGICVFVKTGPL